MLAATELSALQRDLHPVARQRSVAEIRAALAGDELVLAYAWTERQIVLIVVPPEGPEPVRGAVLARGQRVSELRTAARRLRSAIDSLDGSPANLRAGRQALREALLPAELASMMPGRRHIVLGDGPLAELPFDLIVADGPGHDSPAIVYASSASVYLDRRALAEGRERNSGPVLVVADPVFGQEEATLLAMTRSGSSIDANSALSATAQVRLQGKGLDPLPGTAIEAAAIAATAERAKRAVMDLQREKATVTELRAGLRSNPSLVHLATHGLTGSAARPYDASLAFTVPETITPEDIGFLRLEDMIPGWRGALTGTDLVVLSACDTQRGVRRGDSLMALPWGFFYAGAPTVIASLWPVSDDSAALLMTRFYENLLGAHDDARAIHGQAYDQGEPMTKLDALEEAKRWLRDLTRSEADALRASLAVAEVSGSSRGQTGTRGRPRPEEPTRGAHVPDDRTQTTETLLAAAAGDEQANAQLLTVLYDELRDIADARLRRERPGHLLQASALVNEVFLKLVDADRIEAKGRTHFKAIAARAMGQVLIDHARGRDAAKRGGDWKQVGMEEAVRALRLEQADVIDVTDALETLREIDDRKARVVELRFYGGLGNAEVAEALGISLSTVESDWRAARAWLRRELS
jgi:RNA polymerase sigma factor (TIGR02999 family)